MAADAMFTTRFTRLRSLLNPLQLAIDGVLVLAAWWIAFWLRFNLDLGDEFTQLALAASPWPVVGYAAVMLIAFFISILQPRVPVLGIWLIAACALGIVVAFVPRAGVAPGRRILELVR